jgi:hypothetical protein
MEDCPRLSRRYAQLLSDTPDMSDVQASSLMVESIKLPSSELSYPSNQLVSLLITPFIEGYYYLTILSWV